MRLQGFRILNTSIPVSRDALGDLRNEYIAPLRVPSKNLLPTPPEARSNSINFIHSLHRKAHDSADLLEPDLARVTGLPSHNKRLSPRTKRILEGLDFVKLDPLASSYLEDYFSNLGRLILALEMFSDAEMNDKTGRKADQATLDAALIVRDAERARDQIQSMTEGSEGIRRQFQDPGSEYAGERSLSQRVCVYKLDLTAAKLCYADDNLYIEILNALAPAESAFVSGRDGGRLERFQSPIVSKIERAAGSVKKRGSLSGLLRLMK